MLDTKQLTSAKKLCELFLWQYPEEIERSFSTLHDYLTDDPIKIAFMMAMRVSGGFYSADWNEYDLLLLDYLIPKAAKLNIPLPHNLSDLEDMSNSETEDLFLDICKIFTEHGFDIWWLNVDMNCIGIAPQKLRTEIIEAATIVRLDLSLPNYVNYTGCKDSNIFWLK